MPKRESTLNEPADRLEEWPEDLGTTAAGSCPAPAERRTVKREAPGRRAEDRAPEASDAS
jgi:hypothetical protein